MSGANALASLIELYDVAGQIRGKLIALQAEARLTQSDPAQAGVPQSGE